MVQLCTHKKFYLHLEWCCITLKISLGIIDVLKILSFLVHAFPFIKSSLICLLLMYRNVIVSLKLIQCCMAIIPNKYIHYFKRNII